MPKIADIQETPNPNAVKFILKEPVSHGTSHSFKSALDAADNPFARSIFEIGEVVSVFYMDKMVTVEKTDDAEWDEILPELAVPIRAAEAAVSRNGNSNGAAAAVGGAIAAAAGDDPVLDAINALLDARINVVTQSKHSFGVPPMEWAAGDVIVEWYETELPAAASQFTIQLTRGADVWQSAGVTFSGEPQ